MLSQAAAALDIDIVLVDPATDLPPLDHGERVATAFDDPLAFEVLSRCDVVTVELEGVPVAVLDRLAAVTRVAPPTVAVAVSQDRLVEKRHFQSIGIATAPFVDIADAPALADHPVIVKSRRGGYDGRGQVVVAAGGEISGSDAIVEDVIEFDRELSIVAARDRSGKVVGYPLVENRHAEGILRVTTAPAPDTPAALQALADDYVTRLAESLDYVGVLALELFQVETRCSRTRWRRGCTTPATGRSTVPRRASSRSICSRYSGAPLGSAAGLAPATMTNLIGELPDPLPSGPNVFVHLYGKEPRPGRKLGHVTRLG